MERDPESVSVQIEQGRVDGAASGRDTLELSGSGSEHAGAITARALNLARRPACAPDIQRTFSAIEVVRRVAWQRRRLTRADIARTVGQPEQHDFPLVTERVANDHPDGGR